jgi:hypothetical protein
MAKRKRFKFLSSVMLIALALAACSRDQKPIAAAIKPAQQTMEAAKGMEQTLQKAHENREAQSPKE